MTTTVKEELDILDPKAPTKDWTFTDGDTTMTYTQKPLTFFGKIEFFSLVGDTVDKLNTEENPLNITELFGATASFDSLVAVLARVAGQAPEALQEAYCIFLAVPGGERLWVKNRLENDLSDEDGMGILELFIDQNADELKSFFDVKGKSLLAKAQKKFGKSGQTPSSKRTKRTQQSTAE